MAETTDLLARIQKLEAENRRIKWAGLVAALAMLVVLVTSLTRSKGRLEVTDLTVKDAAGTVIAHLGPNRHGTCLELTGRSASRAALCVDNSYGSNLNLWNQNPETSASLTAGTRLYEGGGRQVPGLLIKGEGGKYMLAVNVYAEPQLLLGKSEEENSVSLVAGQRPGIRVMDPQGKAIWAAPR